MHERARPMLDIATAALECGVTNAVSFMWSGQGNYTYMDWVYDKDEAGWAAAHVLGHHSKERRSAGVAFHKAQQWFQGQLAYLLWKLKTTPEPGGDGVMLDHTLIVQGSDTGHPNHTYRNIPYLLAGNVGGRFRTGRFHGLRSRRSGWTDHHSLLATLMGAFDIDPEEVWAPDVVRSFTGYSLDSLLRT